MAKPSLEERKARLDWLMKGGSGLPPSASSANPLQQILGVGAPSQQGFTGPNSISYDMKAKPRKSSEAGGQYDWQGALLKDLPNSMGRSYADKFKTLALQSGMKEEDIPEFKRYLDMQEQGVKTAAEVSREQHDAWRTKFDRNLQTNARLAEPKREAKREDYLAQQAKREKAVSTGVKAGKGILGLNKLLGNPIQGVKNVGETFDKVLKVDADFKRNNKGRVDTQLPTGLDRYAKRAVDPFGVMRELSKRSSDLTQNPEDIAEYERLYGEAETGGQKVIDFAGDLTGFTGPAALGIKAARLTGAGAKNLTKGLSKHNAKQYAKEGALVGGALGATEVGVREAINPDDHNWQENLAHIGINTAAGAALDPLIGLAGPLAKQLSGNMVEDVLGKAVAKQLDDALKSGDYEPLSQFMKNLPEANAAGRSSYSPTAMPDPTLRMESSSAPLVPKQIEHPLEKLINQSQAPQRASMPQATTLSADMPTDAKLAYLKDTRNPIKQEDIPVIFKEMTDLETRINDVQTTNTLVRAEVEAQLAQSSPEFRTKTAELQERQADMEKWLNAQDEWQEIKTLVDTYRPANRPEHYKFHIPDNVKEDFAGVPPRFRKADAKAMHIDEAATLAGYDSIDDFVRHLQQLDQAIGTKRADLNVPPSGSLATTQKLITRLEKEIDTEIADFAGVPQMKQQLDELANFLAPREGEQSRSFTRNRSALDDLVGRGEPAATVDTPTQLEPNVRQEPLAAVAGRADEYSASPIAKPKNAIEGLRERTGTIQDAWGRLNVEVNSRIQPLKTLEKDLSKRIAKSMEARMEGILPDGTLSRSHSFAKNVQMLAYSEARAIHSYRKGHEPIFKLMEKHKIKRKEASEYILAKHARDIYDTNADKVMERGDILFELEKLEANRLATKDSHMHKLLDDREAKLVKQLEELNPYELPEIMTEEYTDHILATLGKRQGFVEIQKLYVKEQRKNPAILNRSGIVSDTSLEAMYKKHPNYVSLAREVPKSAKQQKLGSAKNVKNPLIARELGSRELLIVDPFDSAMKNRISAISAADKNTAVKALLDLSKLDGMEGLVRTISPNDPHFPKVADSVIKGFSEDGKEVYIQVPKVIREVFDGSESKLATATTLGFARGMAHVFKKGTTNYNLQFQIKSGVRDSLQMLSNSRTQAHAGDLVLGFVDSFIGPQLSKVTGGKFKTYKNAFKEQGGNMSSFIAQNDSRSVHKVTEAIRKGKLDGHKVVNPFKHIEQFGMKVEHGPRLAEMRSAKRKGYSDEDAFFEAIDLLDYRDQGSLTRQLNPYMPYLSPTMRGNIRSLQQMNKPQFWKVGLSAVTVPTILNYALKHSSTTNDVQRDKINNMPAWQKNTFWGVPTVGDDIILVPKPFILSQLFANPVERALDMAFENSSKTGVDFAKETGLDIFGTLAPPTNIAGLTIFNEMQSNHRFFTGLPIEDKEMLANPDKTERYNSFTSELAKTAGKATGQSPAKIDTLLKNIGGTVGRQALDVSDNLLAKDGSRPAKYNTNAQILNPLASLTYNPTASSGLYDEIYKQAEQDTKTWNDKNPVGKRPAVKDRPQTAAQKAHDYIKGRNAEIKGIRESTTLSAKEKHDKISKLRDEQRRKASEWKKSK